MRTKRLFLLAQLIPALMALSIILGLTLPQASQMRTLNHGWSGVVKEPGKDPRPIELDLPSRFRPIGLDPHSTLVVQKQVTLPDDGTAWAIHVDSVLHGMAIRWDGTLLAEAGDPEKDTTLAVPYAGPLLALVPGERSPGPHQLEFTIRGALYRGGLAGQIRAAPAKTMLEQLQRESGGRMGFALAFALVGCLHLLGATSKRIRWTEFLFGAFTISVAGYAFEHSVGGFPFLQDVSIRNALRRLLVAGMLGFVVAFTDRFVHGALRRGSKIWLGVLGIGVGLAWLGPWWSTTIEALQDISVVIIVVPWMLGMVFRAGRTRTPGGGWLFAAMVLAGAGAIDEALVTQGIIAGARWMYPALCVFLLFCSLAIARQDRSLSDRHRRLVTRSEDAMLEVSPEGSVLQLNPAAENFLPGLSGGSGLLEVVPPEAQPLVTAHLSRAGIAPTRCEFSLLDGRVVESVATPLDSRARLLVMRDVTRRRRAEDDLITAARIETAGLLLGGVAHDFNNLLGALLGHVGLLRTQVQSPEVRSRLDRMEEVVERASGITRRLLAVGGRSHSTVSEVDVGVLLHEVQEIAEPVLPEGTSLTIDLSPHLLPLQTSAEDLRHVLLNLVLNARDAAGDVGSIRMNASMQGGDMVIDVMDSGPGVAVDHLDRIWEPFFTTKGRQQGSGLGLPMARRLVRQHGGTLSYRNAAPHAFRVRLPARTDPQAPVHHVGGARIAVVDDEETLRQAFGAALTEAGYVVDLYPDAVAALPALVASPPDVLVTDVVMPGMSGLELALALRELQPDLPVLVVSGFVPASEQLLQQGPTEQLDKPTRAVTVVRAVGRLLGSVLATGPVVEGSP